MADWLKQLRKNCAGNGPMRVAAIVMLSLFLVVYWSYRFQHSDQMTGWASLAVAAILTVSYGSAIGGIAVNHSRGFAAGWAVSFFTAIGSLEGMLRARTSVFRGEAMAVDEYQAACFFLFLYFVALGVVCLLAAPLPAAKSAGPALAESALEVPKRRKKEADPLEWTRENIEAIVVAFLMALVIRCFCVEVFKIPTGSMEPTLFGDLKDGGQVVHNGDRIMVDKVGLMFIPVHRFDVCVFRYPLDRSRNFIKRLVGMPDEELKIDYGDLYFRPKEAKEFRIARKPANEQNGIWLAVWPPEGGARDAETQRGDWEGGTADCYAGNATFDTAPAKGDAAFRYRHVINGQYRRMGNASRMFDVRMKFKATFAGAGEVFVRLERGDGFGTFTTRITPQGEISVEHRLDDDARFTPAKGNNQVKVEPLKPGETLEVANFDGAVRVRVGNREVLAYEYIDTYPDAVRARDTIDMPLSFGTKGGAVRFEDVRIDRDIFYYVRGDTSFLGRDSIAIPPGHYLAIGDNVGNSKDSRLWKERVVVLKDGTEIRGDYDANEHYFRSPDGLWHMRDFEGTDRTYREEDVADNGEGRPQWHPFVSREELVGKALAVWWPLERFKLIR